MYCPDGYLGFGSLGWRPACRRTGEDYTVTIRRPKRSPPDDEGDDDEASPNNPKKATFMARKISSEDVDAAFRGIAFHPKLLPPR